MEKFESKYFSFDSGVKLTLDTEGATATASNGKTTIEAKQIDNFQYTEFVEPRLSSTALIARTFGIGFLLILITGNQWNALFFRANIFNILTLWLGLLCFLVGVIAFFVEMIDMFMHFGLYKKLIANIFSNKGYVITIGNLSGNNMKFVATADELNKVKRLENGIKDLKKYLETNPSQPQQQVVTPILKNQATTSDSTLDDLKKLGDLYQSGILTKEEFEQKKSSILNK